jgi:hypothetical protein
MTKLRAFLLGAVIAVLGTFTVFAAGIIPTTWTGAESWVVSTGGIGGQSAYITLSQARNTTGYQLLSSASGTIQPNASVDNLLINAQPSASTTINTPLGTSQFPLTDGELFAVCNVTATAWATNAVSLAAATGQNLAAGVNATLTTLGARTCEELTYNLPNTTWYQVR